MDYYRLKEPARGPAGGFEYQRRQNAKGEEVAGIVPHITLESIANDEPAKEEVLVDRPERDDNVTRVCGPFCVEATIPAPTDWGDDEPDQQTSHDDGYADHVERMIAVLRRSPVLRLGGGRTVTFSGVRRPARTISLSAEAKIEGEDAQIAAIVFGPENGAVSQNLVFEAAKEANVKGYRHLYVFGFCHSTGCKEPHRTQRSCARYSSHLRASEPRPHHGRPAQEHAIEPDFLGLRTA